MPKRTLYKSEAGYFALQQSENSQAASLAADSVRVMEKELLNSVTKRLWVNILVGFASALSNEDLIFCEVPLNSHSLNSRA